MSSRTMTSNSEHRSRDVRLVYLVSFVVRHDIKSSTRLIDEIGCAEFDIGRLTTARVFRARIDVRPKDSTNFCNGKCNNTNMAYNYTRMVLPEALDKLEEFISSGLESFKQDPGLTPFLTMERRLLRESLSSHLKSIGVERKGVAMFNRITVGGSYGRFYEVRKDLYPQHFPEEQTPSSADAAFSHLTLGLKIGQDVQGKCLRGGPCSISEVNGLSALCHAITWSSVLPRLQRSDSTISKLSVASIVSRFESMTGRTRQSSSSQPNAVAAKRRMTPPPPFPNLGALNLAFSSADIASGNPDSLDVSYPRGKTLAVVLQFCTDTMFQADLNNIVNTFCDLSTKFADQVKVATFQGIKKGDVPAVHKRIKKALEAEEYVCVAFFLLSHGTTVAGKIQVQTADDDLISLEDDVLSHYDNKRCPRMAGRVRFALCQMCRGDKVHDVVKRKLNRAQTQDYYSQLSQATSLVLPEVEDFVVIMASVADTITVGNDLTGSEVTGTFFRVLREFPTSDVDQLFREVRRRLLRPVEFSTSPSSGSGGGGGPNGKNLTAVTAIVPEIRHTLKRLFAFFHKPTVLN